MASASEPSSPFAANRNPDDEERYHHPHTSDELTDRNIRTVARLEAASAAQRTLTDRVVDAITAFCGTMF